MPPTGAPATIPPWDERALRALAGAGRRAARAAVTFLPTPRLAAVVAALAPIWLLSGQPNGKVLVTVSLIALVAVVAWDLATLPAAWQVHVARRVPDSVGLGDAVEGAYVLQSAAGRALRVHLFDALPPALEVERRDRSPVRLPAHGSATVPVTLTGRARGRWPLGPIVLRVEGRLGLVQRSIRTEPADHMMVIPSMAGIRRYRLLALHHRLRDLGVRAIRRRGEGTSFANLREYVVGDDPRHIDWKATARRETLITREYSIEQGQTVLIAIDAGRLMTQLAGPVARFEYALSSALLLADVALHSRDHVGLLVFADTVQAFVPPARGRQALEQMRRALVPATADLVEPDYATAFRLLGERLRKRSLIVLFTDVIDPRASQALIAHTTRSAARHVLVVVALRNDELVAAAVPTTVSVASPLFESAAAEELLLSREDALLRMRRAGVSVLDVSPHAMAAAVINRYLEIKARASL